ncbi:hypothetical protein V8F20_012710 [Naviculisporaceae sp. PSN 640]
MVRLSLLIPLFTILSSPVLSAPLNITFPLPDFDLVDWWLKNVFICPLWKGPLPNGFQDLAGSICYNSETKTYTRGTVTARLYQVPGAWQEDKRYTEITNGVGAAIQKGLVSISPLIPTTSTLTINIGFLWGGLGERVQIDSDNSGQTSPCFIIINYPPEWVDIPLRAIQKDVIQRMYQCVEQFYRPSVTTFTEANEWWRRGIARYFDGLSYPTASGQAAADFLTRGLYPEEYSWGITLYQNDDAAALFFHWADQLGGWSPADVNNWMRGHANKALYDEERTSLAADTKITSMVWHKFVLANIDQTIKYPTNGQKIGNTNGGVPKRTHNGVISIASVGGKTSHTVSVDSFKGNIQVFTFKAGQSFSLSVEKIDGVEWSIRKVGSGVYGWNSGDRGRSVSVVVPAGADVKWEIALSSTAKGGGGEYPKVSFTRTA